MMKVCHVITRMILGGAQENTLLTVRGLHSDPEFEVTLVTGPALGPEGELLEDARDHGIEPVILPMLRREIHPARDTRSFHALYRHFDESDYDLVHTHSSKAGILGRWAARMAGVPHVFHTIHGLPFHPYQSAVKRWFYRTLEQLTGSLTDEIQAVCDRMIEKAQAAHIRPQSRYRTVYSGMELEPFLDVPPPGHRDTDEIKKEWGFAPEEFVFGKIARLFHLKGHTYCLRAFREVVAEHPQARLLLIGDGILREELQETVKQYGIDRQVRFAGLIPYQKIPRALAGMDCLVHTSLREGLPRVIPQAQAAMRPPISYALDGAPEAIEHGKTGFLVPPKSVGELGEYMKTIVRSPERAREMGRAGREWVQPQFDWKHMVETIKQSYRDLRQT